MVFTQNSSLFTLSSAPACHFFPSHTRWFKPLTEELWLPLQRHFFFTCAHAHKSLSNEM